MGGQCFSDNLKQRRFNVYISPSKQSLQPIPRQPRIHAAEYVAQITEAGSANAQRVTTSEFHAASTKEFDLTMQRLPVHHRDNFTQINSLVLKTWHTVHTAIFNNTSNRYDWMWHCTLQSDVSTLIPFCLLALSRINSKDIFLYDVFSGQKSVSNAFRQALKPVELRPPLSNLIMLWIKINRGFQHLGLSFPIYGWIADISKTFQSHMFGMTCTSFSSLKRTSFQTW